MPAPKPICSTPLKARGSAIRAADVFELLEKIQKEPLLRNNPLAELPDQIKDSSLIEQHFIAQFDAFVKTLGITSIGLPDCTCRVLEKYFDNTPPFGQKNKKAEFPDAFAAEALIAWCKTNERSIYVVSEDGDWRGVCKHNQSLIYIEQLAKLLAEFPEASVVQHIREGLRQDDKRIFDAVEQDFYAELAHLSEPIESAEITSMTFGDIFVINARDGFATAQAAVSVSYWYKLNGRSKAKSQSTRAVVEVRLSYEVDYPENVDFDSESIDVTLGDIEDEMHRYQYYQ